MKNDILLYILKFYFRYNVFRENQKKIIENLLHQNDTIALLPTGSGKSLLYQLPAVISKGITLVICPLLALMKDQVNYLKSCKISSTYISSELSVVEQLKELEKAQQGKIKLLYISPERLTNYNFINTLKYINISLIAVDEAHCISTWGNDFRPSYMKIKNFRLQISSCPPIIALTGSATEKTIQDIIFYLGLKNYKIFKNSFERKNISIQLIKSKKKINYILSLLKKSIGSSIIYCRNRNDTEKIYNILRKNNILCDFFHAGLSINEKEKKQINWIKSNFQVLISTSALGMGIHKCNVHTSIHFSPSYSLENYYQEIGRIGRDNQPSISYLLWNEEDLFNWKSNIIKSQLYFLEYRKIIRSLYSLHNICEGEQPKKTFILNINKLKNITKINITKIQKVLNFLQNINLIRWNTANKMSKIRFRCYPSEIKYINSTRYQLIEILSRRIMGIFSNEVSFYEKNLSKYLGISTTQLKIELQLLQKEQWIEYFYLKEDSTIKFNSERNDEYTINLLWKTLKLYQENQFFKFKEFEYFIQQNKYCRNRLILGYFNEIVTKDCKKCDICLNSNK